MDRNNSMEVTHKKRHGRLFYQYNDLKSPISASEADAKQRTSKRKKLEATRNDCSIKPRK